MKLLITLGLFLGLVLSASAGDKALGKKAYKKFKCTLCHNANGMGKAKDLGAKGWKLNIMKGPRIAGLDAKYIDTQVNAIISKKRKKIKGKNKKNYYNSMRTYIKKMTPADIKNVAAYVSSMSKTPYKSFYADKLK